MKIATTWSTETNTKKAAHTAYDQLCAELGAAPSFLVAYASAAHQGESLLKAIQQKADAVPLHGATSCLGIMSAEGFHQDEGVGLGLFGIHDSTGDYGVGMAAIQGDGRAAGAEAIQRAIENSGRMGEPPELIWLNGAPGYEENVLLGIQDFVGEKIPIAGGSAADNNVEGLWYQFTQSGVQHNAVVVTAMYPSTATRLAFHSGYTPTDYTGTVTRAVGRTLHEIDGQPAAVVYNQWTNGVIEDFREGGNILMSTTLFPLGRVVGQVGQLPYYQLSHPETVTAEGAITLFSEIDVDDEITLMRGTTESLIARAGHVAQTALDRANLGAENISGALVVYCAGCMLTVQDQMDQVAAEVRQTLGKAPFLGVFTFGEQGCFIHGENRHGNLMISVVVFE